MKTQIYVALVIAVIFLVGLGAADAIGKTPLPTTQGSQPHTASYQLIGIDDDDDDTGDDIGSDSEVFQKNQLPPPDQITYVDFIHYPDGTKIVTQDGYVESAAGYALMGVKWKHFPVWWWIDVANNFDPMTSDNQYIDMKKSLAAWDKASSKKLKKIAGAFSNIGLIDAGWTTGTPDGWNTFEMDGTGWIGSHVGGGVIGLCRTYYTTVTHEIVESDIILNDNNYWWSSQVAPVGGTMRVQNIGTHEMGHAYGLADIYTKPLATMYGFSTLDETQKCSLWTGDIQGIRKLYG